MPTNEESEEDVWREVDHGGVWRQFVNNDITVFVRRSPNTSLAFSRVVVTNTEGRRLEWRADGTISAGSSWTQRTGAWRLGDPSTCNVYLMTDSLTAVSYTHLTLPTILRV